MLKKHRVTQYKGISEPGGRPSSALKDQKLGVSTVSWLKGRCVYYVSVSVDLWMQPCKTDVRCRFCWLTSVLRRYTVQLVMNWCKPITHCVRCEYGAVTAGFWDV